ncbi:MAG: hypothetical protein ACXIUP_08320 [Microcella sp.]
MRLPRVSSIEHIIERSETVRSDPTEGHRELWAYLTLDDAAEAFRRATRAEFSGCLPITVVSPQSLADIDVAATAHRFYRETPSQLEASKPGFTIERAQ